MREVSASHARLLIKGVPTVSLEISKLYQWRNFLVEWVVLILGPVLFNGQTRLFVWFVFVTPCPYSVSPPFPFFFFFSNGNLAKNKKKNRIAADFYWRTSVIRVLRSFPVSSYRRSVHNCSPQSVASAPILMDSFYEF